MRTTDWGVTFRISWATSRISVRNDDDLLCVWRERGGGVEGRGRGRGGEGGEMGEGGEREQEEETGGKASTGIRERRMENGRRGGGRERTDGKNTRGGTGEKSRGRDYTLLSTYLDVVFVVSWYGEEAVTYLYGGVSGGHEASDLGHDYGAPDLTKERALGAVGGGDT
jgi:hypothetical protein